MADELDTLVKKLTAGVYVVGVSHNENKNAFTAAWLVPVSFNPLLISLSINPEHASFSILMAGRVFSVNVLGKGQMDLARHFGTQSGRDLDKLEGIEWHPGKSGAPILADALAYLDCRAIDSYPAGDHILVVGQVIDGAILHSNIAPMTYEETGDLDGAKALYSTSI